MSGEGRRSNQAADAQQIPPGGAESARRAEEGTGEDGAGILGDVTDANGGMTAVGEPDVEAVDEPTKFHGGPFPL